jgi:hypothetical protein
MAEEKLNLLEFASRGPTEASASSTQVVWREPIVADPRAEFFYDVPNQLRSHAVAPGLAGTAHLSEELSCLNARRICPVVQQSVDPIRHWDGPNMAALPN